MLRDRLVTGRFDAALLAYTREAEDTDEAVASLSRAGWACDAVEPESAVKGGAALELWFRRTCRTFPLVSLDRVIGLRPGLAGVSFDAVGRIDWSQVREVEGS
jgi:hypothetical protein